MTLVWLFFRIKGATILSKEYLKFSFEHKRRSLKQVAKMYKLIAFLLIALTVAG
jgi:hypothetical protein